MIIDPMQSAHRAPRCRATSKRTGRPCGAPAVRESSPTRPAGELLTTGGQRAMEMLESNVVGMGVRRKYDHQPHGKRP